MTSNRLATKSEKGVKINDYDIATLSINSLHSRFISSLSYFANTQAVASKLHGVEVDIKIIKRKGDPIMPAPDVGNIFGEIICDGKTRCSAYKHDKHILSNKSNDTKVPHSDNHCEKSECVTV
jgi:esterase/lipase